MHNRRANTPPTLTHQVVQSTLAANFTTVKVAQVEQEKRAVAHYNQSALRV